ncbi:MAG: hypothetical protein UX91_C0006G0187 [Candidatus Amesbacteria bacterium GW2011_GWB1_47_19]|nr:MAG: hypothetical protein UW51_C0002G0188 [Candidatus Amesbacteria bacterium GW2011_GWA1_44_24]KKU31221.1 MAG: hypothetical protein UX46_C0006G0013 [Candidatus Amesbacteria bacterium GW2011_GWC1_46_24]KKU67125.1 MAG: hypothetical protein UX91_C0006G0187 [Candidatus Amesbacteria bacterium GW2011_GWB1_47_19]OGD05481.1 MAG: hypothetical protein A2379_00795 [Candidatus Amesbacteria bacterium RIFOXYB1_FULL_47_13]HBC72995.1 hypothetical protein [Candidatus Amesbacteria bacterium]
MRYLLVFLVSLTIFSSSFFIQRAFMTNFDENGYISTIYLMQSGRSLYRDVFTHHFPFVYYWVRIFSPFNPDYSIPRTITVFRLTLLAFYLINFLLVYFSFRHRYSRLSYSVWIILLSTFFTLYHGNIVLSEIFSAILLSSLFWLCLTRLLAWETSTRYFMLLLVLFSSAAFWIQPLLILLSFLPLIFSRHRLLVLLSLFAVNLLPPAIFVLSGQLSSFWEQAILFNIRVYSPYFLSGLPVGNRYIQTALYLLRNEYYLFTHIGNNHQIFQFTLHLGFYLLILWAVMTKNLRAGLVLGLFFFTSRVREVKIIPGSIFNFGIYPFLVISSAALISLLFKYSKYRKIAAPAFALLLVLSLVNSQPILKDSLKPGYQYHVFWSPRQQAAELIESLTRPDEKILVYPHDMDLYALSRRFPPDRFIYWFPWVDSVPTYRLERLTALASVPIPVIFLGSMNFNDDPDHYSRFFPDLVKNYIQIEKDGKPTRLWLNNLYLSRLSNLKSGP